MSTDNIDFYDNLTKIIFQISSNTHLIPSSGESQTVQTLIRLLLQCTFMSFKLLKKLMVERIHVSV